ncbi:hypothetical protein G7Y89_g13665 [Cudoniella acicularis]|uniref:Uncharacterized protein n=1 Tax=Cudoniella acicularis TaxID=354080 RepID=A0A8H4R978_9HELO|nr:hypothetical protein G7Y89_g13665 [Cudoniella acicularis]
MHGLDADPELKNRILQALKVSPGSAIFVNGIRIYRGYEQYFEQLDDTRDRPFEQPFSRRRSRSPVRGDDRHDRHRVRSRSPIRGRSPRQAFDAQDGAYSGPNMDMCSPPRRPRYRTPSPPRQSFRAPSPARLPPPRPRSPKPVSGSNAVVYEARGRGMQRRQAQRQLPVDKSQSQQIQAKAAPSYLLLQNVHAKANDAQPRAPLGQLTNSTRAENVPRSGGSTSQSAAATNFKYSQPNSQPLTPIPAKHIEPEPVVNDPHFVLGIGTGAREAEIVDAYNQKMWEIEIEKISDGSFTDPATQLAWDDSVRILKAAKRKLVGY